MPKFNLNAIMHFTLFITVFALLGACSSPIKYQSREHSANNSSNGKVYQAAQSAKSCRSPYVVQSGDTLSGIAYHCDIAMAKIAQLNHLLPPYIIYVKQELILPSEHDLVEVASQSSKTSVRKKTVKSTTLETQSVHTNSSAVKPVLTKQTEISAKALDRNEGLSSRNKSSQSKSRAWQWPMHKGLSYRYLRDKAGLSVLEIYGVPGQEVRAVAPGKVVYAGNGIINYGWMLVIKHDNDYMSIYAHNSALLVKEGDVVEAGDQVATMGATGNTKRPKLYVEARFQGRKVDIKKVLKQ
ncbi:MAG: M23 family metallopeptidase [Thiomicrorhabdus sp.]|nr:M23 family metallopeptidase [Thiomicrorhabdus sp.]